MRAHHRLSIVFLSECCGCCDVVVDPIATFVATFVGAVAAMDVCSGWVGCGASCQGRVVWLHGCADLSTGDSWLNRSTSVVTDVSGGCGMFGRVDDGGRLEYIERESCGVGKIRSKTREVFAKRACWPLGVPALCALTLCGCPRPMSWSRKAKLPVANESHM